MMTHTHIRRETERFTKREENERVTNRERERERKIY